MRRYCLLAGQRLAMRDVSGTSDLLTDHIGPVVAVLDGSGAVVGEQRYKPFGQPSLTPGIGQTDVGFTGQRSLAGAGLQDFNARWLDSSLGMFSAPDSLIANPYNPQSLNPYGYVMNNPLRYTDPTGLYVFEEAPSDKYVSVSDPRVRSARPESMPYRTREPDLPKGSGGASKGPPQDADIPMAPIPTSPWEQADDMMSLGAMHQPGRDAWFLRGITSPLHGTPQGWWSWGTHRPCGENAECKKKYPDDNRFHMALDSMRIGNRINRSIYAVGVGTVYATGAIGHGFGNYVVIEHDVGGISYFLVYAHLQAIYAPAQGEAVGPQTLVGSMGQSGEQPTIHLHFEVRRASAIGSPDAPFGDTWWALGLESDWRGDFVDISSLQEVWR